MAQYLSHSHIEMVLSGHRVTGYAEEDRPIEFEDGTDRTTIQMGKDGGSYGVSESMFGGKIMVRLAPTSPTTAWFITRNEEKKQAQINNQPERVYDGSYTDSVQGRSVVLSGGTLIDCPDMSEPGQTFEVGIFFERIAGNVDGAVFHAPLVSDES